MSTEDHKASPTGSKLVMIVDDEPDMLTMLSLTIRKKWDCQIVTANSGIQALEKLGSCRPDVVISDIKMPDLDGLQLLRKIREHDPTISVLIMTGYGTIEMAVEALKNGAYDFLQKPFEKDHIIRLVGNCLERTSLLRTNIALREKLQDLSLPEGFIGQSPPLKKVLDLLARVADTDATVLIRGESGTGKEVAARALHNLSKRKNRRLIAVNCPALPENILESELFGYSRGAFTGAMQEKRGLFLEAHGSTILLDEIGDIPVSLQTKLLRVLQEKEIQPLGQNDTIQIDARVVASTNQNLEAKITRGEFREDLFYRLNVVTIVMPSLSIMQEDVPLLIHHFLQHYQQQYDREHLEMPQNVLNHLYQRSWPGNVRELKNMVKRLVLLSAHGNVSLDELSPGQQVAANAPVTNPFRRFYPLPYNEAKAEIIRRFSEEYIENLLGLHGGNVTSAAIECGLERQALQRLMRRYNIRSTNFKK